MLQPSLYNKFKEKDINKKAVTIVTQVKVDKDDPAFKNPTKPVGPFYSKEKVEKLQKEKGWTIIEDSGRGYRRIVPSPIPIEIIEREAIKNSVDNGFLTIAVGGIPIIENERCGLKGQEAVIDKYYASSLLARNINADLFIISTAVEKVYLNFNKPNQKELDKVTLSEAKKFIKEGHFAPGSVLPKINAAINFLEDGNDGSREVILTNPENISRAIQGKIGTRIIKY